MRIRSAVLIGTVAVVAGGLAGCPNDSCSLETPQVAAVPPGTCTVGAGQPVTYEVRVCPACNQTDVTCTPQVSGGSIFLDVKMQACTGGSSCPPPSCNTGPTGCTFTAPNTPGVTYNVVIPDGQGGSYTRQLAVVPSGTPTGCTLASAGPTTF